jgi:hypothetical protein
MRIFFVIVRSNDARRGSLAERAALAEQGHP